ncbi:MAG: 50S ribosomal protein L37ae [Nitrososphaerota archaeon]|jgi:large subunit ribosomal protein L37Ae|nr:50S ribosomal protein L37ae [Nitrososphaerota archaeon]
MKKVGSTRGLGARYGSTVRKRYIKVITELKKPHRCPQCGFVKVHRVSVGVWQCNKCNYTYAGGAYTPVTKLGVIAKRSAKSAVEENMQTTATPVAIAETVTTQEVK